MINLREKLIAAQTRHSILLSDRKDNEVYLEEEKENNECLLKAHYIITETIKNTQQIFKKRVEKLTTMAIRSVFDRPYEFRLDFDIKRNKPECKPVIVENGEEFDDIKFDKGGGILPIISFALRVVMWSLERPRSRNVMVLDEPIKGAIGEDGDLITKVAMMFKEVSERVVIEGQRLQLIIITHEKTFLDIADRAWRVIHDGTESKVKLIKGE